MTEQLFLDDLMQGIPDVICCRCAGESVPTVRAAIVALKTYGTMQDSGPTATFTALENRGLACRRCSPPNLVSLQTYHIRQDEERRRARCARGMANSAGVA